MAKVRRKWRMVGVSANASNGGGWEIGRAGKASYDLTSIPRAINWGKQYNNADRIGMA